MGIQKCKNCGTEFEYKFLLKPLEGFDNLRHCSNCGAPHKVTFISRIVLSTLIMLPAFFREGIRSLAPTIPLTLVLYLIYLAILKVLSPFILRYGLKDTNKNQE